MDATLTAIAGHRVAPIDVEAVCRGQVRWAPSKSLWFIGMTAGGFAGGALTFIWSALLLFVVTRSILQKGPIGERGHFISGRPPGQTRCS